MKRNRTVLACALLAACSAYACSGVSSDGGQSGTGISAIRGNVVAVIGAAPEVADILVSLAATNLTTLTDANGRFELRGNASGAAELRFERQRDGLFARTDVVVPAGGVLDLQEIELDSQNGEVRPARQRVEFEGIVEALDCAGGTIRFTPKDDDPAATVFTVEVASATIRDDGALLACVDLNVGDRAQVLGETTDGSTLVNAEIELEEDEGNEDVEFEGIVRALDCADGKIHLTPKDDDPAATVFIVEAASATIRNDGVVLSCEDLEVGDRFQVHAERSGSTLVNAELELEESEDSQDVEFEGIVQALDCAGGAIRLTPKDDDPGATMFTVEVASATIRDDGVELACGDLQVGDRVQVHAETADGSTLVNAELELEEGEDGPGDEPGGGDES